MQYRCDWCGNEFERNIRKLLGQKADYFATRNKKGSGSDQVKCRKCGNFIKSWS